MSRVQKNVEVFLIAVVLTALIMYFLAMNVGWGIVASAIIAGGFAGFTLIAGLLSYGIQSHRNKLAFEQKQKAADNQDLEQVRTIEIDMPFEQAFDMALEALQSLDNEYIPQSQLFIRSKQSLKIHKAEREIGRIKAGLRAKTFGIQDFMDFSRIEIQVQKLDENTSLLQIESAPTMPFEVYDLARHMHYVNHLALYLRKAADTEINSQRLEDESVDFDANENQDDVVQSARNENI